MVCRGPPLLTTEPAAESPDHPEDAPVTDDLIDQTVAFMRKLRVELTPGLSDAEITSVQDEFGFAFNPDHRALLQRAQPTGDGWNDWRRASRPELRAALDWPVGGLLSHVASHAFWPASWGRRPDEPAKAVVVAQSHLATWPQMVPICGHRYLPASPSPKGVPVFSIYQSDVIFYGSDLLNYVMQELQNNPRTEFGPVRHHIPGWSDLAQGAENADL